VQAFVPVSHITDLPRGVPENERQGRLAQLVGRQMGFKVIEVDRQRRRLVLSQRNAQKEFREKQKARLLSDLAEGQVRTGTVTGLRDFGAFVDLGGADGLIHISELSWRRVKHPSEVLAVGDSVEIEVLKVDRESKRIGLSLKRRQPDPWQQVSERLQPGQSVDGTVTRLAPFGAFVDLGEGVEGLLPTNQIANQPEVQEGAAVRVRVLNVEPDRQRIGLALQSVAASAASEAGPMDEPEPEPETEPVSEPEPEMAPVNALAGETVDGSNMDTELEPEGEAPAEPAPEAAAGGDADASEEASAGEEKV
jgi:small subunit ribosomal protein S1